MRAPSFDAVATLRRVATAALVVALAVLTGRAQGPAVPRLVGPAAPGARVPAVLSQRVDTLQSRPVGVNATAVGADAFDIELEPGRVVRAVLDRRETHRNGAQAWAGHIPTEPLSSVTLTWRDGVFQGSIRTLDGAFSLEPTGVPGVHALRRVDTDATGFELEPLTPPETPEPLAMDSPPVAADDGSSFDVIAFYTPAAAAAALAAGTGVDTRIALGVSETNTAYANSGVVPRLRLVGSVATNYTESGNLSTDLSRFRTPGDGFMDEVHSTRDAAGADLVVLVVGDAAAGACGVGYVMTSLSSGFAGYAFSVTAYPCISPNYTFAHELGHNMGSAHAPEDGAGQASLYAYSFGYKNPSNLFRTVMAYNCSAGCPRVLYFSNPNVNYSGAPTGTVAEHNNALSIDNARSTIANWRQAVGSGTPPTITAVANVAIAEDGVTAPLAFTVGDAETAASSLVVTAASSNTTLVPNTGSALTLGGSGASRTLTIRPAANQFGTASITVGVSDGALTASRTFTITVTPTNDAPAISRSPAAATILVGTSAQTTVTMSDSDSAGTSLVLTTTSSNAALLPNANVAAMITATTATTRTFVVTMTPVAGQVGSATVTLTGSDGLSTAGTTFSLAVSASLATPGAPSNLAVSFTGRTVQISWTAPTSGDPVSNYSLEVGSAPGQSDLVVFPLGAATSFTAGGVPDGVFWVRVRPANAAGAGPATADLGLVMGASGGCVGLPMPPFFNTPTVTGNAVGLSWSAPAGPGPTITSYVLAAGSASGLSNVVVFDTGSAAPSLSAVAPSGVYYVRTAARNACGIGAPSNEVVLVVP